MYASSRTSRYAIISGPSKTPIIPNISNPPSIPMSITPDDTFTLFEIIYGSRRLSIHETRMPPYKRRKIAAPVCPVKNKYAIAGTQTSHAPSTGMIDAAIAITVNRIEFGIPAIYKPMPVRRP